MKGFEKEAKAILEKHGCCFIKMISECAVVYKNKNGNTYCDDIAVLRHMSEDAWKFLTNN